MSLWSRKLNDDEFLRKNTIKLISVKSTELNLFLLYSLIENPLNGTRAYADTNLDKLLQYMVDDTAPMIGAATFPF